MLSVYYSHQDCDTVNVILELGQKVRVRFTLMSV